MYEELVKSLRDCAEVNSLSLYKRGLMKQAADAIEELSKESARWQAEAKDWYLAYMDLLPTRWISVEERLPEKYHQVLCYGVNGMSIDYYSGETSVLGRPLFMVSEARVTHWMPLPEPPKEGE